jgi:predicted nucleic acid-binding protein
LIVIDTSVPVKWTVKEDGHKAALDLLELDQQRIAPDVLIPELAYVLRKKTLKGEIAEEQIGKAISGIRKAIDHFVPSSLIVDDAIALSKELDHSPYDCFFLACAIGRGVLITADRVFASKCEKAGYGSFVTMLQDAISSQTSPSAIAAALDSVAIQAILRLASRVEATFDSLKNTAKASEAGRFEFRDAADFVPAFTSPAYVALAKLLDQLPTDDLSMVLALGWLGRSYHQADDWPGLLSNARGMAADGAKKHQAYFMAQMASVRLGIEKFRAAAKPQSGIKAQTAG